MRDKIVVQVDLLRKAYGSTIAVDNVSFEVYEGEIFGMVGPNGAGKTTTVECVEGLRQPDAGQIQVLRLDPQRDGYSLRARIGVQLQQSALQERLKVWEALDLFASFYRRHIDPMILLEPLGLTEKRNAPFARLSGGQKQRLFIALALVNDPELVFLDELTTGLDPQARRAMWDLVRKIRDQGKTVFLTTHFMEEAERLCDRVAIMDHGRLVALDTPQNLIRNLGVENRVVFTIDGKLEAQQLLRLEGVTRVEFVNEQFVVYGRGERLVGEVVKVLSSNGIHLRHLRTEQPTLEDVFLALTGKEMRD
ncbi:MAG: ABC transporter ATP-binding protein [candidate division KSB1 bacterium]|nr:ABC transporter ATP-binding protein [candidate division KSB1 bacterium]MDZ7304526.1 ABC transporter ATP-binding protein [candidate division KSB1 bacterium]MDZ7314428.1 ABC transporter ATP-binding protein [candidate division KSB1 bacterium]